MNEDPTYDELLATNRKLQQKVEWLEGVYHSHRDAGLQVRSRFLSNITHEIRTPMNAILGFSDILQNSKLTTNEREEYLRYITLNSQALLKVMDNIMDLSLLETNSLVMRQEEVLIKEMFREIYDYYNYKVVRSYNYRVALLMSFPNNCERVTVSADPGRLYRLLDNLVNTAITSQQKGVVEMKLEINQEEEIWISIIGKKNELLEERAQKIFENNGNKDDWHYQLDAAGLSFKLARDLMKAMKGRVSLVKVDGKRIGIRIELPAESIRYSKKKGTTAKVPTLMN